MRLAFTSAPSDGSKRDFIPPWLAESPTFADTLRRLSSQLSSRPFKALKQFMKAMFVAAKVARRVKLETSSVNLKVSQRVALFKLVVHLCQDRSRTDFRTLPFVISFCSMVIVGFVTVSKKTLVTASVSLSSE